MEDAFSEEPPDAAHLRGEEAPEPRTDRIQPHKPDQDDQTERSAGDVEDVQVREDRSTERHITVDDQEPEDDEQVQEALGHDHSDRSRQRNSEAALHQVAPVQIAELRRHQAVHEPAEEQDLEKVAPEDPRAALAEQARPPDGADRERQVVHDEGRDHEDGVRASQSAELLLPIDIARKESAEGDRDHGRDELAPAEELTPYRDLVGASGRRGELLDRRVLDVGRGPLFHRVGLELFRPSHFRNRSYRVKTCTPLPERRPWTTP